MTNELKSRKSILALVTGVALACAVGTTGAKVPVPGLNNPTGTRGLFLVDKVGSRVRFFDASTNKEVSNLDVGAKPHEFAIAPDHKTAYVSVYGDGIYGNNPHPGHVIAVIDLASRQQAATTDVSPYIAPHGIMVDANGTLYVTCDLSRGLRVRCHGRFQVVT